MRSSRRSPSPSRADPPTRSPKKRCGAGAGSNDMRWSIIRLIWLRELRDQLRDRRTLFMIVVLPLLLYPVLGYAVLQFAFGFAEKPSVIGVVGSDTSHEFPKRQSATGGLSPLPWLAWLRTTTQSLDAWAGSASLAAASHGPLDYPPLINGGAFASFAGPFSPVQVRLLIA